jgi:hypothetical protein
MRKNSKQLLAKTNRTVSYSDGTRNSDMEFANNVTGIGHSTGVGQGCPNVKWSEYASTSTAAL